jgi:hypothetical protein
MENFMKKIALRALTLSTVVLSSGVAFAQDETTDENAPKLDITAFIRSRYALYDSTRKGDFDFTDQRARLGAVYTQGIFAGEFEVEFRGNNNGDLPTSKSASSNNAGVRQAWLAITPVNEDSNNLSVGLGRYLPKSAYMYGNDATAGYYSMSGYDPTDGVFVNYIYKAGNSYTIIAQGGVASSLNTYVYGWIDSTTNLPTTVPGDTTGKVWLFDVYNGSNNTSVGSDFGGPSNTDTKAYLASLNGFILLGPGDLELTSSVGFQNDDPASINTATTVPDNNTARDQLYIDAAVGYRMENINFGMWMSYDQLGVTKTNTNTNSIPNGGVYDYSGTDGIEDQYYQAGIGGEVSSKQWGITNLIASDDAFTLAAGIQHFAHRQSDSTATGTLSKDDAKKNDVRMYSVGVGYVKGPLTCELNYSFFHSENDVFYNRTQDGGQNSANVAYLVAQVDL